MPKGYFVYRTIAAGNQQVSIKTNRYLAKIHTHRCITLDNGRFELCQIDAIAGQALGIISLTGMTLPRIITPLQTFQVYCRRLVTSFELRHLTLLTNILLDHVVWMSEQ
jgi:hypothetical protein